MTASDDDDGSAEVNDHGQQPVPLGGLDDLDREKLHLVKASEERAPPEFHTLYSVQIITGRHPDTDEEFLVCNLRLQEHAAQIPLVFDIPAAEFLADQLLRGVIELREGRAE